MKLTTSRPTTIGWYWLKGPRYLKPHIVYIRQADYPPGTTDLLVGGTTLPIADRGVADPLFDSGWLWAGPIELPEEP